MRAPRSTLLALSLIDSCSDGGLHIGTNDASTGAAGTSATGGSGGTAGSTAAGGNASGGSSVNHSDSTGACTREECPGPPLTLARCPDGTFGAFICRRRGDSMCGYELTCPPPPCTPEECGTRPGDPNERCRPQCTRVYDGFCTWVAPPCAPPPPCRYIQDRATCERQDSCRWLEPGCADPKLPVAGCYDRSDIDCAPDRPCTDGRTCFKRVVNPCLAPLNPDPNIGTCDACGAEVAVCL
jgi:hypothetical protein